MLQSRPRRDSACTVRGLFHLSTSSSNRGTGIRLSGDATVTTFPIGAS